jgi:hypothetical protein
VSSSQYVTLKEFGAGSGWHARVLSYAKKRMHIFKRIKVEEVKILADKLGGISENFRPYESVKWTVSFEPLPTLKILCLLVTDEEFGTDFFVYFNRKSADIYPAEDVIIFSTVFICLLAQEAEYLWTKKQKRLGSKILEKQPLDQKKIHVVQQITPDVAEMVASNLGGEFAEISEGWSIVFKPIPEFPVTYAVTLKGVQIKFDNKKAQWMPGVAYAFKWLYLNAIIREARKLDSSLPQISFSGLI